MQFVKSASGDTLRILAFRKRKVYDASEVYLGQFLEGDVMRIDLLSYRLYAESREMGKVIDVNDKDVFSFVPGETYRFAQPEV